MIKCISFLSCLVIFELNLYAQIPICGTAEYLQTLLEQNPNLKFQVEENEAKIQQWINENEGSSLRNIITIPVVVHIVWHTDEQDILDPQIQSQIDVLNEDFSRSNLDAVKTPLTWQNTAVNPGIQFCLAQRDTNGNPTSGIIRVQTTKTSFNKLNNNVKHNSSGGSNAWPTDSYLNIWVCKLSPNNLKGYAQFPNTGLAKNDGVVIDYKRFGRIGVLDPYTNKGRCATHEIGHWLNLYHIWSGMVDK